MHQVIGEPKNPFGVWVPEDLYGQILDWVPIVCVDVLVINKEGLILVAERTREPAKGKLAMQGSRIQRGEDPRIAAARTLKTECDIDVVPTDVRELRAHSYFWEKRAEPPENNGSHTISLGMWVRLPNEYENETPARRRKYITFNSQFKWEQWVFPQDVLGKPDYYDPVFIQLCKDYLIGV